MKNRMKKNLILLLSLFLIIGAGMNLILTVAKEYCLVMDLFDTTNIKASPSQSYPGEGGSAYGNGLSLSGGKDSFAKLNNNMSGELEISLLAYTKEKVSKQVGINFSDVSTNENFSLIFDSDTNQHNVKILRENQMFGLYYHDNGGYKEPQTRGLTKIKNAEGIYTTLAQNDPLSIIFEPNTMRVYVGDKTNRLLVWDLKNSNQDGKDVGFKLDSFKEYKVSIFFPNANKNDIVNVIVYDINGLKLSSKIITNFSTSNIFAEVESAGKTGANTLIPKPYASSLTDRINLDSINVSVTDPLGNRVLRENYHKGMFFIPQKEGEYRISYFLAGVEKCVITLPVMENFSKVMTINGKYNSEYIDGQTIEVFDCEGNTTQNISSNKCDVFVSIKKDGEILKDFNKLSADKKYLLTLEKGNYTIEYSLDESYFCEPQSIEFSVIEGAYFERIELDNLWNKGDILKIPSRKIILGDREKETQFKLIYPSGKCFANEKASLNEVGEYTLVYEGDVEDKIYTDKIKFSVVNSIKDIVSATNSETSFAESKLNDDIKGLLVESKNDGIVEFNTSIDLSKNTKDDLLLELMIEPTIRGSVDFNVMEIFLTDVNNPDNYLRIMIRSPIDSRDMVKTGCYVSAGHSGQELKGIFFNNAPTINDVATRIETGGVYGYGYPMSFYGETYFQSIEQQTFKLYYDNNERALYLAKPWSAYAVGGWIDYFNNKDETSFLLMDFDDENYFSNPWGGFSSGEVKLSIKTSALVKSSASYIVTELNGIDFKSENVYDKTAPSLYINLPEVISKGVVGLPYSIFSSYSYDAEAGMINSKVSAYYLNGSDNYVEIGIFDNKFTPPRAGRYILRYSAKDSFGNLAYKDINIDVERNPSEFTCKFNSEEEENHIVGKPVSIANILVEGRDIRECTFEFFVTFGEKDILIKDGEFLPTEEGTYIVKVVARDYNNIKYSSTYKVKAVFDNKPILNEELTLPLALNQGKDYKLIQTEAIFYSKNGVSKILPEIYVSYDDSTKWSEVKDGLLTVSGKKTARIKYKYIGTDILEKEFIIPISTLGEKYDMSDLFIAGEKVVKKSFYNGAHFSTNSNSEEVIFSKPLSSSKISTQFLIDGEKNNFSRLKIELIDAKSHNNKIELILSKKAGSKNSVLSINGVKLNMQYDYWNGKDGFGFFYSNSDKSVYNSNNEKLLTVRKGIDKKEFKGFSTNLYIRVSMEEVVGESGILWQELCGQSLSDNDKDSGSPIIELDSEFSRTIKKGETLTLPKAKAYDVLSEVKSLLLTVTNKSGEAIKAVDGTLLQNVQADREYTILFSEAGKYYISYSALDTFGNPGEINLNVAVIESVELDFKLESEFSKIVINQQVVLPKVIMTSGKMKEVNVFVITERGTMKYVAEKQGKHLFTFEEKGKYKIRYFVYDDAFNYKIKDFDVTVN